MTGNGLQRNGLCSLMGWFLCSDGIHDYLYLVLYTVLCIVRMVGWLVGWMDREDWMDVGVQKPTSIWYHDASGCIGEFVKILE